MIVKDATKYKEGSYIYLGNGYKAVVKQTAKGKRWVILSEEDNRPIPNVPNHKYISDAENYYKQYLINKPANYSQTEIDSKRSSAETLAKEAYDDRGKAIDSLGDKRFKLKAVLDAANAIVYGHNIDNPDKPITLTDIVHQWYKDPSSIPLNIKDLFDDQKDLREKLKNLLSSAEQIAQDTGSSVDEVLEMNAKNFNTGLDSLSPDGKERTATSLSEEIKSLEPKVDNETYLGLVRQGIRSQNKYDFLNALKGNQEGRKEGIQGLRERIENKDYSPELSTMKGMKGTPYESIWGSLEGAGVPTENVNPQDLFRMGQMQGLSKYKGDSFRNAKTLSGSMPNTPIDFQWDQMPTYDKAKGLWDELRGNYTYGSAKPYDNRMHNLALAGHAEGSSSIENAEAGKTRAMHREDLENIAMLHNMLLQDHRAKGDTVGFLDNLFKSSRGGYQDPLTAESNIMGDSFDRQNEKEYRGDVLDKDLTQMEGENADTQIKEGAALYDLLERDRMNEEGYNQGLENQINELKMLASENKLEDALTQGKFAELGHKIFMERRQIEDQMRRTGLLVEAQELEKEKSEQAYISKLVSLGGKAAISAAIIASTGGAGTPAALAMWAPEAASLFEKPYKERYGGQGATSGLGGKG